MTFRDKQGYEYKTVKAGNETQLNFKVSQEEGYGWKMILKEQSRPFIGKPYWTATLERKKK